MEITIIDIAILSLAIATFCYISHQAIKYAMMVLRYRHFIKLIADTRTDAKKIIKKIETGYYDEILESEDEE